MYDLLLAHDGEFTARELVPLRRRARARRRPLHARAAPSASTPPRVSEDVASADESGVSGTPTFFINGRRHYGVYDIDTLAAAVKAAKTRARQVGAGMPG